VSSLLHSGPLFSTNVLSPIPTLSDFVTSTSDYLTPSLERNIRQSWSIMVRIELYPLKFGSLTIKLIEVIAKGLVVSLGVIGCKGSQFGCVIVLLS